MQSKFIRISTMMILLFMGSLNGRSQMINYSDHSLMLNLPVDDKLKQTDFERFDIMNTDSLRINALRQINPQNHHIVLFFHGNGDNLWSKGLIKKLNLITQKGYNLIAIDYPGYGKSKGSRKIGSLYKFADLTYTYVRKTYPHQKIVIWGQSLGTIPALYLAGQRVPECLCLITESTITTLPDLKEGLEAAFSNEQRQITLSLDTIRHFNNYEAVKRVKCKVVFIHGQEDKIAKADDARKLFDQSPSADKRFVELEGKGHNYNLKTVKGYLIDVLR